MTENTMKFQKLWEKLGTHGIMVLSTCADNRVTSRSMSVVVLNEKLYFQTDETFLKFEQISKNANVSVCIGNLSIEGVCRCIGKPDENEAFTEAFKMLFRGSYDAYTGLESERVLEITPTLARSWEYENEKPYMQYWNFENMTYKKESKTILVR